MESLVGAICVIIVQKFVYWFRELFEIVDQFDLRI